MHVVQSLKPTEYSTPTAFNNFDVLLHIIHNAKTVHNGRPIYNVTFVAYSVYTRMQRNTIIILINCILYIYIYIITLNAMLQGHQARESGNGS